MSFALIKLLPAEPKLRFMAYRNWAFPFSIVMMVVSLGVFSFLGLNLGIDFRGGTVIEIRTTDGPADVGGIRTQLNQLQFGDVEVQSFGNETDVLIRIEQQPGGDQAQQAVVNTVRAELGEEGIEYRRFEVVGPRVSGELAIAGITAVLAALCAILIYIWVRFEWQFAIGAIIATVHDVILTLGLFAVTGLEFNLSSIAAILTIVGYSLNDTVVVYDRVRENLRRYKKMAIDDLIDLSVNSMLSRTIMTSVTTLIALGSLFIFGGEIIRSFTAAMIWGVLVGTYSSIFVAGPVLIFLKLRPSSDDKPEAPKGAKRATVDSEDPNAGAVV
ncbi:MAG: protein translocase subunit SecF [Pseudomonadota bacterium]